MVIRRYLSSFFLVLWVAIAIISCSHNQPQLSRSIAATNYGAYGLPEGVQNLLYAEQILLSRDVNEDAIYSPKFNMQDEFFKPENQNIFELKTYWINEEDLKAFKTSSLDPKLEKIMYRKINGVGQWRLIVHPESEDFYSELIKKGTFSEKFLATSTASSRTLIVWKPSRPDLAFFGKLSLNKEIGGTVRTIPGGEVARSVGTTTLLDSIMTDLPKDFSYLPETLGIMPKGFERGGMIIREIPEAVKNGKDKYIPLFSLYAKCLRCKKNPLLMDMINQSKMDAGELIRGKIISPFLDQWLELLTKEGIVMEAHAQNVLIGIDEDKIANGKFLHRDFGGFNIDLKFRHHSKLKTPKNMAILNSVEEDYHQKFHVKSIEQSLHIYFIDGFVYNLDKNLSKWVQDGLIPEYGNGNTDKFFRNMVYKELAKKLGIREWSNMRDPEALSQIISKRKYPVINTKKSDENCFQLIKGIVD